MCYQKSANFVEWGVVGGGVSTLTFTLRAVINIVFKITLPEVLFLETLACARCYSKRGKGNRGLKQKRLNS